MKHARAALAALGLGMAVALVPASPAWACSCVAPDPATQITIEITDSAVADAENPFGGGDDFTSTVDLRGAAMSVLSDVPALLDGADIESVPVLAAVLEDPNSGDSCGTQQRPESGSDVEVSGTVMDEGEGAFIYSGPCSGSFIVMAGPDAGLAGPASSSASPGPSLVVPIAIGAGGLLVLGLFSGGVVWPSRRDDP